MVVTGAGDETLRFWNIFPTAKNKLSDFGSSSLYSSNMDLR
jgi:cell division cycle 20-like protein 1 (cofactor of APC complex)